MCSGMSGLIRRANEMPDRAVFSSFRACVSRSRLRNERIKVRRCGAWACPRPRLAVSILVGVCHCQAYMPEGIRDMLLLALLT